MADGEAIFQVNIRSSDVSLGGAGSVAVSSIAAGDNNIGNVDVLSLPALPAGSNLIGGVDVPLATAGVSPDATAFSVGVNAGTAATQLPSNSGLKFGVVITNTHASQDLYIGFTNATKVTQFFIRVRAGENSGFIPVANSNLLWVAGSGASTTYTFGAC